MKRKFLCFLMSASLFTLVACGPNREDSTEVAEEQNEETLDNRATEDAEFAVEAANGGMLEVQLGTLALTKASSPQVKEFAQMMVDEHSKANNELKQVAQQKNITLPQSIGNDHQKKYENLAEKTGKEFDKEYMDLMVKEHKQDIDEFEDQAEEGNDPDLKSWASSKLPTLKEHLQHAERVQETVKEN